MCSLPPSVVRLQVTRRQSNRAARIRPASSRGDSSHDDASGAEERNFGAGVECRLAVVRAVLVELSPGRCDGAQRGLDASSRDRDCTRTCGTFALGPGTSPEDARGPFGLVLSFWGSRCGIVELGVTQNARNRVRLAQRSASDLCAAVRHRSDCETTSSAAAETKSCCIQFCTSCAGR